MTVTKRGKLPDGSDIIIEDWTPNYPGLSEPYTVGTYPIAKASLPGAFSPKAGDRFRCGFTFPTVAAAETVFSALTQGTAQLSDYAEYMEIPRYRPCI
jgi:hypothetical protein